MRLTLAAALALLATAALADDVEAPSMESGHYADLCREKNTRRGVLDERYYKMCFERQTEGNRKLAEVLRANRQYPWLRGILEMETALRLQRGTRDDDVLAFTVNRQIESFKDYNYETRQPGFDAKAGAACTARNTRRGTPDWDLIMSCYKHRAD